MDSWTAATLSDKQWYLAVGERTIGPLTTDLVMRGIRSGRVPWSAWACQVGASQWSALSSIGEFQRALSGCDAPEPNVASQLSKYGQSPLSGVSSADFGGVPVGAGYADSEQDSGVVSSGLDFGPSTQVLGSAPQLPSTPDSAVVERQSAHLPGRSTDVNGNGDAPPEGALTALPSFADEQASSSELETRAVEDLTIDIHFEEEHESPVNWLERFHSYFLVGSEVELPEESRLLLSLRQASRETFLHDEALWNLSLCLAFGSDTIADATARTFFEAVGPEEGEERVEWICRTLLSKGFMPSGIPRSDGMRGIEVLRQTCPPELRPALEREAME